MPIKSVFGGKAVVTFVACCSTDLNVVVVNVIIVLVMLLVIGSIIHVVCIHVVFSMLFILLKAFAILVKCQLVVVRSFGVFFLLAMVRS